MISEQKTNLVIKIRRFTEHDIRPLWQLKFNTIRSINAQHYSASQIAAWAPEDMDMALWRKRITEMNPYIAEVAGKIVGFADLQLDGYIDHFFCHKACIGQGVGGKLMQTLIQVARSRGLPRLYSNVSITAKPFFAHYGFTVIREQLVEVRGERLQNYQMEKWTCR